MLHGADVKMTDMDTNQDGKVSWEEYKAVEFHPSIEEGWKLVTVWFYF